MIFPLNAIRYSLIVVAIVVNLQRSGDTKSLDAVFIDDIPLSQAELTVAAKGDADFKTLRRPESTAARERIPAKARAVALSPN